MAVAARAAARGRPARAAAAPARAAGGATSAEAPGGAAVKVGGDAEKDPRFRKVVEQLEKSAKKTRKHPPASKKAAEAQAAAVSPPNERNAGAKANQVDAMKSAEAPKAEPNGFLALLRAEIEKVMPKNLDDADKFMKGSETEQVKGAVSGGVKDQKDTAAGPTEQATAAAPDPSAVPARAASPLPEDPASPPPPVNTAEAMPAPKPAGEVQALQNPKKDSDQQMKDADLTPTQLKKANDPRFSAVLSAKTTVEKTATAAPGKYLSSEKATLGQAVTQAKGIGKTGLNQMAGVKTSSGSKVKTRQMLAKAKDEARRKEVTETIEKLYQQTKVKVETKLSTLETDVMRLFDVGAEAALADMKSYANREIDRFKDDRYSGITGGARWIADLFRDVPEGIKVILRAARGRFATRMDALAVRISATVDSRLADAKAEVDKGQAAIKTYVASLPRDLQAVGKQAQQEVASRFDELRSGIDAKKNDLAQKLAQKYKEAHDKADAALKKLEDENKGALKGLVDAIGEIIKILSEFKDKLMAVLRKGADTIMLILKDPIGFLGNLLAAIKQGFNQFVGNIWTHLKRGFMEWLFGSLASAGIQVPSDLNVWSILKLVLDVLGLTYAWMRGEAVKLVGERNVALVEKLVEYITTTIKGGPQALWEKLKEDLSNLKAMVIDAIQDWLITTIVKQAVTKIVSMFNPAGAIVQAVLAIYNVVMWVIENASRILALIEAIVNSLHAIATGAIGGAAKWIENALASLIPIVIGFLARLIGLGGISAKIREFITKVQAKVRGAVLGWLKKAWAWVKKLFGRGGGAGAGKDGAPTHGVVKKGFAMGPEGHTLTAKFDGKKVDVYMASAGEGLLRGQLNNAVTEVTNSGRHDSQKRKILGDLKRAGDGLDSMRQDWTIAGGKDPRGGTGTLNYDDFAGVRMAQIVQALKGLEKYDIHALHRMFKPARRQLPPGYKIRKQLYDRGSGWTKVSKDIRTKFASKVQGEVRAVLLKLTTNPAQAQADWRRLKVDGKIPDTFVLSPTFALSSVTHSLYDADHDPPLGVHWAAEGYNSNDQSRNDAVSKPPHPPQAMLLGPNRSKGGVPFQPHEVGPDFTSSYAEGGRKNAATIDGQPFIFLNEAGQPIPF